MDNKDNLPFEIAHAPVEVGETYPLYGMITKIISEEPDNFVVELNFNIEAHLTVTDPEKIQLVKKRAFEPGIFVSTVVQSEPNIVVNCTTVVFGKPSEQMQ